MKEAGIAGFHNFDAGLETPQIVSHRVEYMTPEWKDCFRYAIDLADSLDLEVTIAASPGWSESSGARRDGEGVDARRLRRNVLLCSRIPAITIVGEGRDALSE